MSTSRRTPHYRSHPSVGNPSLKSYPTNSRSQTSNATSWGDARLADTIWCSELALLRISRTSSSCSSLSAGVLCGRMSEITLISICCFIDWAWHYSWNTAFLPLWYRKSGKRIHILAISSYAIQHPSKLENLWHHYELCSFLTPNRY
jgi:hypothetical protein